MFTFGGFKRGSNLLGRIFLALQEPKVLWQSQILDVQIITGRESLWCCLAMTHDQVKLILAKSIKTCKYFGAGKLLDFRIMPQHRRSYAIWMSRVQRWRDWRCFFTPLYMLCWNVNKYTHTHEILHQRVFIEPNKSTPSWVCQSQFASINALTFWNIQYKAF